MANGSLTNFAQAVNNPATFVPTGDPFAGLTELLTKLQSQSPMAPEKSRTQQFLDALQQSLAIGASKDSGQAVSQFLKQKQDVELEREKFKQQKQNQLMVATIQSALERARGMQEEQTRGREQARTNIYERQREGRAKQIKIEEEIRKLNLDKLRDKDQIDALKLEIDMREELEERYKIPRQRRARELARIQAIPEQEKRSVDRAADYLLILPDLDPTAAVKIARKFEGLDFDKLTPDETGIIKRFSLEKDKRLEELRKAEVTYKEVGAKMRGKDVYQDSFDKAFAANQGREIDTTYFRVPMPTKENPNNFIIKGKSELSRMDGINPEVRPLSPEDNEKEIIRRAKLRQQTNQELQRNRQEREQTQPKNKTNTTGIPQKLLDVLELGKQRKRTDEQLRIMLKANGATQEQINKLVPPSPQSQTKPNEAPKTKFERAMEALGKGFKINQ